MTTATHAANANAIKNAVRSARDFAERRANRVATLDTFTAAPTLALLDGESVQGDGIFKLTRTAKGVRAEKDLPSGLTIVKNFELGSNYLVLARIQLTNRTEQPMSLPVQEWFGLGDAKLNAPIGAVLLIVLGVLSLLP